MLGRPRYFALLRIALLIPIVPSSSVILLWLLLLLCLLLLLVELLVLQMNLRDGVVIRARRRDG